MRFYICSYVPAELEFLNFIKIDQELAESYQKLVWPYLGMSPNNVVYNIPYRRALGLLNTSYFSYVVPKRASKLFLLLVNDFLNTLARFCGNVTCSGTRSGDTSRAGISINHK